MGLSSYLSLGFYLYPNVTYIHIDIDIGVDRYRCRYIDSPTSRPMGLVMVATYNWSYSPHYHWGNLQKAS